MYDANLIVLPAHGSNAKHAVNAGNIKWIQSDSHGTTIRFLGDEMPFRCTLKFEDLLEQVKRGMDTKPTRPSSSVHTERKN